MSDFVTLTCPSCGGKLQVTSDIGRFACGYCGAEHVVKRGGGIVSLSPVVEGIKGVKIGVDKTASELAIRRLGQEISILKRERAEAEGGWIGSNYGRGCFIMFVPLLITSLIFIVNSGRSSGVPPTGFIFLAITIIVSIMVIRSTRSNHEVERSRWYRMDCEIKEKIEELEHHQRIVSGY